MVVNLIKYRKIYFILDLVLILFCIVILFSSGLKTGIELNGGSLWEVQFKKEVPEIKSIREILNQFQLEDALIQPTNEGSLILRMKEIDDKTHQELFLKLKENWEIEERRFEMIGPTIGKELRDKAKITIILSLLAILFYISLAFQGIKKPVSFWQCGLIAVFSLFHDVLITLGSLSFLKVQVTIPIITALLTVIGYSINNTVVVYDRIRENILGIRKFKFEEIVNQSLIQTINRQINTSLTTLFPLLAILFLGGETLKYFALTLIIGILAGTFSSFFLAGPLLVEWAKKY